MKVTVACVAAMATGAASASSSPIAVEFDFGPLGPVTMFDPLEPEPNPFIHLPVSAGQTVSGYEVRFAGGNGLLVEPDELFRGGAPRFASGFSLFLDRVGGGQTTEVTIVPVDSNGVPIPSLGLTEFRDPLSNVGNTLSVDDIATVTIYGFDIHFNGAITPQGFGGNDPDFAISVRGNLTVVPTPASAALLGLAGLAATRRRR